MFRPHSKVTAQGQIELDEEGGRMVVRRSGPFTSAEIHQKLFPNGMPQARTLAELRLGLRNHASKRHARD